MIADPQGFANQIATIAAVTSVIALIASVISIWYARTQCKAAAEGTRSREFGERTVQAQADALKMQAEDFGKALTQAERSAAASEASARAADKSVAAVKESMQRTLRAYVTLDEASVVEFYGQKVPLDIRIALINTGQTPARKLEVLYHFAVLAEVPESFEAHRDQYKSWTPSDIGKDQRRMVFARLFCKQEELQQVLQFSATWFCTARSATATCFPMRPAALSSVWFGTCAGKRFYLWVRPTTWFRGRRSDQANRLRRDKMVPSLKKR